MFRLLTTTTLCLFLTGSTHAQDSLPFTFGGGLTQEPGGVEVSATLTPVDAKTADLKVAVKLPEHHYIYSTTSPFGLPTKFKVDDAFEVIGKPKADRKPKVVTEQGIGTMEKFYDAVTWTLQIRAKSGQLQPGMKIAGELTGQYCSAESCLMIRPPATFEAAVPADFVPPAASSTNPESAATTDSENNSASVVLVPKMRLPPSINEPPINFTVSLSPPNPQAGDLVSLTIKARIDRPFHTYSITQPRDAEAGLAPTEINLNTTNGLEPVGSVFTATPIAEVKPATAGEGTMKIHHDEVTWQRDFVMTGDNASVSGDISFQICNERACFPQAQVEFTVATAGRTSASDSEQIARNDGSLTKKHQEFGQDDADRGFFAFIIAAMGAGFLALLTPCVYPMIPVTISYFLKQGEERPGETIKLASIYCASIVAAFTVVGLAAAVIFGPEVLQVAANNKWLNLFFAAVFTVFALMLMGMFEISMPSWLLTWTSKKQETGGYLGVVFMALTFTLVSFTCTFVFVGKLLVVASQGSYLRPIAGMAAFSTAFASPFFLLAIFPSLLQKIPKSGGWMNRVKVTLGLLELAIVSKFLSVADTGFSSTGTPMFLDYHLVIASWIVVAIVTGIYLLNVFRTPHDAPNETVGGLQCMFAMGFMGIGAYLLVGLFSARPPEGVLWQQVAAFAPPQIEVSNTEKGYAIEHDGLEYSLDFDAAVEVASKDNKPMFLDFTGVNCVNCRQMERVVLVQEEVHDVLENLVRVQLFTDIVPGVSKANGDHDRLLKRNQDLQKEWMNDVTIPVYVIATPDGSEVLAAFKGKDITNGTQFKRFLAAGMKRWEEKRNVVENGNNRNLHTESPLTADVAGLEYSLDYKAATLAARESQQLVFFEFTGVNSVIPRQMEQSVLSLPAVKSLMSDMRRVQAFTDTIPGKISEEDRKRLLDQNRDLQKMWLKDVTVPAFVLAAPDGTILSTFKGLDVSGGQRFQEFLTAGLQEFEEARLAKNVSANSTIHQVSFPLTKTTATLQPTP